MHPLMIAITAILLTVGASGRASAQLVEAASSAKSAYDFVKGMYDAYKAAGDFLQPPPSTADLIAAAVQSIENLIVDSTSANAFAQAQTAIDEYQMAVHAVSPSSQLAQFDSDALASLNQMSSLVTIGQDPRYAHWLGSVYNTLLPLYLANHLAGRTWGSTSSQSQLEAEFIAQAEAGLQLDYDMIGGTIVNTPNVTDTTTTSQLGKWVIDSSKGGAIATTATLAAAYYQTDATVQAVQRGAGALIGLLLTGGVSNPYLLYDRPRGISVTVDRNGWTNNWRGAASGIWTSIQPYVYSTTPVAIQPCPKDFGMVSVRQMPFALAGYLCVPFTGLPVRSLTSTSYVYSTVHETCSAGLCSEATVCSGSDATSSATFGVAQCVHRVDSQVEAMPKVYGVTSTTFHSSPVPAGGFFYDVPAGRVLTGIDPTDYSDGYFTYFYGAVSPSLMVYAPVLSGMMM